MSYVQRKMNKEKSINNIINEKYGEEYIKKFGRDGML